ncbi:MAG: carboxymuconolactone decarboxylase family protein [bacterium]
MFDGLDSNDSGRKSGGGGEALFRGVEKETRICLEHGQIMSIKENHLRANQSPFVSLMEGDSGLSRAEKEMITVRVSSLNGCDY